MSTPGSGGPQPPEQDPSQLGQPSNWGQQPPAGQPYPGQQPPVGQPYPGQQPAAGQRPWDAAQPPAGQQPWGETAPVGGTGAQAFGQPAQPDKKRKWLPIVGGVIALLVVLGALTTFLGGGEPEIGDCIKAEGTDSFSTVDCDSDDAQYRVVGTDEDMNRAEFDSDQDTCLDVADAEVALWSGKDEEEDGHVYCAAPV